VLPSFFLKPHLSDARTRPALGAGCVVYCTVRLVELVMPPELAPMVVLPTPAAVARPAVLGALAMVATEADDELQWTFRVMSWVVLSLNVPVAVNCCLLPLDAIEFAGVMARETSVPLLTVRVVVPFSPEALAVIVTLPVRLPKAVPELRMEATLGVDDFQDTPARLPPVLPSLKVPTAVNFTKVRASMRGLLGRMAMPTSLTVVTVRFVLPVTESRTALMVVLPAATLLTSPWLLMAAAAGFDEPHNTEAVTSCELPSLKLAVAVNCLVVPTGILELAGVTVMAVTLAPVTVSAAVPVTEPEVAVIVAVPVPTAVAKPEELMVATEEEDEDHVTEVNSCVLPSLKLPTALNC